MYQIQCFLAETVLHILIKDRRCLHCQRTIDEHIKMLKLRQQMFGLDPSDKIKHLLCSADRKCRNHQIAAPCKCILQYPCKCGCKVRRCLMLFVTVSGFHYDIIGIFDILRIFDEWTVAISNISGKYNLNFIFALFNPHLNA